MASYIWHDWMQNDLALSGNDLLVYSVIYSYSQDGKGTYYGSQEAMAQLLGVDVRTIKRILGKLIESGYISKSEGTHQGAHTFDYVVCQDIFAEGTKCPTKRGQNVLPEGDKMSHNNKIDNKDDNKNINPSKRVREEEIKLEYAEGVSMSENEYGRLCDRFGKEDTDLAIEYLSLYKQEKNYKTKSDRAAIHRWVMNAARKDKAEKEALERKGIRSAEKEAERERKRAEMEAKSQEILRKYEMED